MTASRRLGRKPGPVPTLSRDDVARAAIEEGVLTTSMPAVARRLGVSHSTLYRYIHDRDDLALAALDLAAREFDWPSPDLRWPELLGAFADALWRFLEQHPGMAETIQGAPRLPARITELEAAYARRLRADGLGAHDAAVALDLVADLVIATEIAVRGLVRVLDTPHGRRSLRELHTESWAALVGDEPGAPGRAAPHGRALLADKLALLVDGLASRVSEPVPAPPALRPHASDVRTGRAAVVAVGRELAREAGLGPVTPQKVADRLGCTTAAVRAEVGDRDGLVVAMLDAVAEAIVLPAPAADPRTELVDLALAVHDVLRADPWAVPALAGDGLASPLILPLLERVFTALAAAGVPDPQVLPATRLLWDQVFGAALATGETGTFATRVVRSADHPTITRVTAVASPPADQSRAGVELVVDALLRRPGLDTER